MKASIWSSDIVDDERWAAAFSNPEEAKAVRIYCFDADGVGVKTPDEIASRFGISLVVALYTELVTESFAAHASKAWDEVLAQGFSDFTAQYAPEHCEARIRIVNKLDRYGCIAAFVSLATINRHLQGELYNQSGGNSSGEQVSEEQTEATAVSLHPVGQIQTDMVAIIQKADDVAAEMLGYATPSDLVGVPSAELIHPADREFGIKCWFKMLETPGSDFSNLVRYKKADGSWLWVESEQHNLLDSHGYVLRQITEAEDRGTAAMAIEDRDRVIQGLADVLPSGIAQFDDRMELVFSNDRWYQMTGITERLGEGALLRMFVEPTKEEFIDSGLVELFTTGSYDRDVTVLPAEGSTQQRRWRLALRTLEDSEGNNAGMVACVDDITDSWVLQNKLVIQATRDDLTGLANRTAVLGYLDDVLHVAASTGTISAVIFIDLNGFKQVNDVLGHGVGDGLLQQIADSLRPTVRPNDLVARLGGDEFIIVCVELSEASTAMEVARRAVDSVTGTFHVKGEVVEMGASCGVAIDVGGAQTAERLIVEADLAMYEQKRINSGDPGLFESSLFEDQRLETNRDAALATACHDGSLVVHYQPIVDIDSGETVGYEALLRWMFEGELVFPDDFIGLAERRGLIEDIGEWVLNEVASQAASDPRRGLLWSVNVSPLQLRSGRFDGVVRQVLYDHDLAPSQLVLEITEGLLATGDESKDESLRRVSELGVQLVVDDFGTGFASLNYLRTLPVQGLKIDRCFTADIDRPRTQIIVQNVLALAEALSLHVVVEGIETKEQAATLSSLGVTTCQGYYFARPAPYDTFATPDEVDMLQPPSS